MVSFTDQYTTVLRDGSALTACVILLKDLGLVPSTYMVDHMAGLELAM